MTNSWPLAVFSSHSLAVRYTPKHEWVSVENGVAKVGISDYAQVCSCIAYTTSFTIWLPVFLTNMLVPTRLGCVHGVSQGRHEVCSRRYSSFILSFCWCCDPKDSFAVLESVKATSDVYAPMSGECVEVNPKLLSGKSALEIINEKAETDGMVFEWLLSTIGWLAKFKVSNASEFESLLQPAAYKTLCESEEH